MWLPTFLIMIPPSSFPEAGTHPRNQQPVIKCIPTQRNAIADHCPVSHLVIEYDAFSPSQREVYVVCGVRVADPVFLGLGW